MQRCGYYAGNFLYLEIVISYVDKLWSECARCLMFGGYLELDMERVKEVVYW